MRAAHGARLDRLHVIHTRVFAVNRHGGNPCPVVLAADHLSDADMQQLARSFGLDTVFVLKPHASSANIRLRYFVPNHEMGISGHATIAAIAVALANKVLRTNRVVAETASGLFETSCVPSNGSYLVTLEQNPAVFGAHASANEVAAALRIPAEQIAADEGPIQIVSVSRPKLLVPLKSWRTLDRLSPDFDTVWRLCDAYAVSGLYPFTRRTNKSADAEARQFPLRAGFLEDAATGVAAAALGAYLARYDLKYREAQHVYRIAQGYAMGAPSRIEAIVGCVNGRVTRAAIRGIARIVRSEQVSVRKR